MFIDGAEVIYAVIGCLVAVVAFMFKYLWGVSMGASSMYATKDELLHVEESLKDAVTGVSKEVSKWVSKIEQHHKQTMDMQAQQHKDMMMLLEKVITKEK